MGFAPAAALASIQQPSSAHRSRQGIQVVGVGEAAVAALHHQLTGTAAGIGGDRHTTGHRLHHHIAKGLVPLRRIQKHLAVAQFGLEAIGI